MGSYTIKTTSLVGRQNYLKAETPGLNHF